MGVDAIPCMTPNKISQKILNFAAPGLQSTQEVSSTLANSDMDPYLCIDDVDSLCEERSRKCGVQVCV